MIIRRILFSEEKQLASLLEGISLFTNEERGVAIELLRETEKNEDYFFYVTQEDNGEFSSFICFGQTPMTTGTYDMYWIGTRDDYQRKGLAGKLVHEMKQRLADQKARMIRIETSGKDDYSWTREFYLRQQMTEEARLKDFYKPGDDLVVYIYRF